MREPNSLLIITLLYTVFKNWQPSLLTITKSNVDRF